MRGYGNKPGLGGAFVYLQLDLIEPADLPFDATAQHAFELLALRWLGAIPAAASAELAGVMCLGRSDDCELVLLPEVTAASVDALAGCLAQSGARRLAVWSPRPDTLAAALAARGVAANCYGLLDALTRGQVAGGAA